MRYLRRNYYGYAGFGEDLSQADAMLLEIYNEGYPQMFDLLKKSFYETYYAKSNEEFNKTKQKLYQSLEDNFLNNLQNIITSKSNDRGDQSLESLFYFYRNYGVNSKTQNALNNGQPLDTIDLTFNPSSLKYKLYSPPDNYQLLYDDVNIGTGMSKDYVMKFVNSAPVLQQVLLENKTLVDNWLKNFKLSVLADKESNKAYQRISNATQYFSDTKYNIENWINQFKNSNIKIKTYDEMLNEISSKPVPKENISDSGNVSQVTTQVVLNDSTIPVPETSTTQVVIDQKLDTTPVSSITMPDPKIVSEIKNTGSNSTLLKVGAAAAAAFFLLKGK